MAGLIFLNSAKLDFREIQDSFNKHHGAARRSAFRLAFKNLFADIKSQPLAGTIPEEASNLGLCLRQRIVEQIRVIYEVRDDTVYIRLLLSTRRDFAAHLIERLLPP